MPNAARVLALFLILSGLAAVPASAQAPAPGKPGGILRMVLREDLPQGFSIHETATNSVTWPSMPCYSNLVVYCLLYTSPSPRDRQKSRMPSSA